MKNRLKQCWFEVAFSLESSCCRITVKTSEIYYPNSKGNFLDSLESIVGFHYHSRKQKLIRRFHLIQSKAQFTVCEEQMHLNPQVKTDTPGWLNYPMQRWPRKFQTFLWVMKKGQLLWVYVLYWRKQKQNWTVSNTTTERQSLHRVIKTNKSSIILL